MKRSFDSMCDFGYVADDEEPETKVQRTPGEDPVESLTLELQEVRLEYHKIWQETSQLRNYIESLEKELQLYRDEDMISRYIG